MLEPARVSSPSQLLLGVYDRSRLVRRPLQDPLDLFRACPGPRRLGRHLGAGLQEDLHLDCRNVAPLGFKGLGRSPLLGSILGFAQSASSPRLPIVSTGSVLVRFLLRAKRRGIDGLRRRARG